MKNIFTLGKWDLSKYLFVNSIERPVMNLSNTFVEVRGHANRFLRNQQEGKEIIVTATYFAKAHHDEDADLFQVLGEEGGRGLAEMLYTPEPTKLVLGDRPELFDLVVLDGEVSAKRFAYTTEYTIRFKSPYPCAFGAETVKRIPSGGIVENPGDLIVYPKMRIPSLSNEAGELIVTNQTTGAAPFCLKYTQLEEAGVEIDHQEMTCTVGGVSIEKYIALESRWISLAPGENTILVSPDQPVEVSFYPMYRG